MLFVVIFFSTIPLIYSVGINLHSGRTKCIGQSIYKDDLFTCNYSLSGHPFPTSILVTDSNKHVLFNKNDISQGKFTFVLDRNDRVTICIHSQGPPNGIAGKIFLNPSFKSYEDISAKTEAGTDLQLTILGLERISNFLQMMEENSKEFKERQEIIILKTEKQNQYMMFLSLLTLILLVGLGIWQFFHLKKYFKDKRIL